MHEEGVTIGEVCRMTFKHIWAVLISSVLFAAALTLLFVFVVNPLDTQYSMSFYLTFPGSETLKYPDGSAFSYREFVSYDALARAKASDERFGSVDVDGMIREDDISVTAEFTAPDGIYLQTGNYTIVVEGKYFSSRETAQAFIRAVAQTAVDSVKQKAESISYTIDEDVFSVASFEDKLALLREAGENILSVYDEWIDDYRAGYSVGGKALSTYRAEAAVACSSSTLDALEEELETRGYVPLDELDARISDLQREQRLNEEKIQTLREMLASSSIPDNAVQEMIAELMVRNVEIENEMDSLTEENITAFEARIDTLYERVQSAAETVKAVSVALYEQESAVHFSTNRAVVSGGVSPVIVAVGGFIVAFLIAVIVACSAEMKRSRRQAEENAAPSGQIESIVRSWQGDGSPAPVETPEVQASDEGQPEEEDVPEEHEDE